MKQDKYWNPYLGGVLLGLLLFFSFFITGHGLGASGGLNRFVVAIEDLFASRHVDLTPYLAHMAGADKNPFKHWIIWLILGTIIGGITSGLIHKRFKVEIFKGPHISNRTRLIAALIGGMFMGYGARLARGCTSGQALSGGAVLSAGSWAFMLVLFASAYIVAIFARKLWR